MFVTFEGPEGAGKSSALRVVAERLRSEGISVLETREPGSGPMGPAIRQLLLDSDHVDSRTELLLFLADRAQHVASVIRPALAEGRLVLCDRYADSTMAYQGHARGFPLEQLRSLIEVATAGLQPDLTLLFDLEPRLGLSRLASRDRLDAEPLEFHEKVRQGFLTEAARSPERFRILDASQPPFELAEAAVAQIQLALSCLRATNPKVRLDI